MFLEISYFLFYSCHMCFPFLFFLFKRRKNFRNSFQNREMNSILHLSISVFFLNSLISTRVDKNMYLVLASIHVHLEFTWAVIDLHVLTALLLKDHSPKLLEPPSELSLNELRLQKTLSIEMHVSHGFRHASNERPWTLISTCTNSVGAFKSAPGWL